ncbi:hypothetical protein [Tranquillimonas alkanivorans]|uniref:Na+-transporting NADH:ubiquinone oxidoreductase subunit A n=1 Tax=Tranquillimonas alkanivorans TaxID=441119 RepID=A0A1I5U3J3_9RHOB|nr:hypothetical protein [Tranquillimonas alkanivorans]SFP89863.1 Na+-transporting NADH:ubiquinone oxidoreductase subunit A [Tranquillimonas alkanivorans]
MTAEAAHETRMPERVALTGADCPGVRPRFAVEQGQRVARGETVFVDRARPEIAFAAPMAGTVARVEYGPRRTLGSLVIAREERDDAVTKRPEDVRAALLARGLWPAFRTRPFGRIPDPDAVPDAIFVIACEPDPAAPDPAAVITQAGDTFARGLKHLTRLTEGPVWVCQHPGANLAPVSDRVRVSDSGRRPAERTAAAHVHRCRSVADTGTVWTVGYQDVMSVGALMETGRFDATRTVMLTGPLARRPRAIQTVAGADLRDLSAGEVTLGVRGLRLFSGTPSAGRQAAWLGRDHRIVTLDATPPRRRPAHRTWLGLRAETGPRPIIPSDRLDHALPRGIYAAPLMRALAVGDAETAERLGCLDLLEDDVALLSPLCTSGADYRPLLRRVLDELEEAR